MFSNYKFDERNNKLDQILSKEDKKEKKQSLEAFIEEEETILSDRPNKIIRSRALTRANNALGALVNNNDNDILQSARSLPF